MLMAIFPDVIDILDQNICTSWMLMLTAGFLQVLQNFFTRTDWLNANVSLKANFLQVLQTIDMPH